MTPDRDLTEIAPPAQLGSGPEGAHVVQFYEGDGFLLDTVDRYIGPALAAGDTAVVIATHAHRHGLAARLLARGLGVRELADQGRYVAVDAGESLASFMVGEQPDPARFGELVGSLIAQAASGHPQRRVHAFGEMVALLYDDGQREAAIRLEELWNDLAKTVPFSLMCAYSIHAFRREDDDDRFHDVCSRHSHVLPADGYATLTTTSERLRDISLLQRKASALDAETAERKSAEKSLARSEGELRDFFENAAIGILWLAPDSTILRANRAQAEMLGYGSHEHVGRGVAEFIDAITGEDIVGRLARGETLREHEARLRCRDGSFKHVLLDANALWEEGRLVHNRCFVRDVTDRKLAEAEREKLLHVAEGARAAAEAASRAKDEFLAMLGHELRNPLSAVRNAVVTARLDATRRDRALDIAQRQTERLSGMVDDLLDVARITQGKIVLNRERVLLTEVVHRTVDAVRSLIEEKGLDLSISIADPGIAVEADPMRLEQVLMNLLTNAAKYGSEGNSISLVVERAGDEAVLRLRDQGIGIAPDMLPRVFDLFAQGDGSLDRVQGGLGIGLTIVQRLVELHGGRVEAHSDGPGKGAEFVVYLPAADATADSTAQTSAAEAQGKDATRVRVLIVEDNADSAESLAMLLELLGHEVSTANDGNAGVAAARAQQPDVMLVDIGLPGMDGYEVARCVRGDAELKHIVLVALTGYGQEEDRRQAIEAGFDHHQVKPIDPRELEAIVAGAKAGKRSTAVR